MRGAALLLARSLARVVAIGALLAVAGVWFGRAVAETGFSAIDAILLALFALPVRPRSLAPLFAGVAIFGGATAVGLALGVPIEGGAPGYMRILELLRVVALVSTARALAELTGPRLAEGR